MNKMLLLSALFFLITTCGYSTDPTGVKMESSPSMKFILTAFETLSRVAPEHKKEFHSFEERMLSLLKKIRKLDIQFHRGKRKGESQGLSEAQAKEEGRKILRKAFVETENYLIQLHGSLQKNREAMVDHYLPE